MNLEGFLLIVFIPVLAHSGLIFLQVVQENSQYNDLTEIELEYTSARKKLLDILSMKIAQQYCVKDIFLLVLVWIKYLKVLALLPAFLYLIAFLILVTQSAFQVHINTQQIINLMWGIGIIFQLVYIGFKLKSKFPSILKILHSDYSNKAIIWIILDFAPICK